MFWYLLNRAGLLNERESDLKNDESLKRIYDDKFAPEYGLNFVNLVDRPTVEVTELTKGEEQAGVHRAFGIIRKCRPKLTNPPHRRTVSATWWNDFGRAALRKTRWSPPAGLGKLLQAMPRGVGSGMYRGELKSQPAVLQPLRVALKRRPKTLVYSAHDEAHNQAVVLREFLLETSSRTHQPRPTAL